MQSLVITIVVLVAAFFVQKTSPMLAGFIAVLPIKILGTAFMAFETKGTEHLQAAIGSMLVWQFVWGAALLIIYLWLRNHA